MIPRRLLLSGRLGRAVADELQGRLPELSTRTRERPNWDDLSWADSFSGFTWPQMPAKVRFNWVHSMGAGVDAFLDAPNIGLLTRTVGRMPERMGNFVLALLLDQVHHLGAYAHAQSRGEWHPREPRAIPKRAVILGTGAVAAGIARSLTQQGLEVVGVNRSGAPGAAFHSVHAWDQIDRALENCELLVAALPRSTSTVRIIDRKVLGLLRSAHFINVGRGSTLDAEALHWSLGQDSVRHADLDVFHPEPPPADSWLWSHPRIRMTPHVAALTTAEDVADAIVATVDELSRGVKPHLIVDGSRTAP